MCRRLYLFQKRAIGSYKWSSSGTELINIRFRTSIFVSLSVSKRLHFFRFVTFFVFFSGLANSKTKQCKQSRILSPEFFFWVSSWLGCITKHKQEETVRFRLVSVLTCLTFYPSLSVAFVFYTCLTFQWERSLVIARSGPNLTPGEEGLNGVNRQA